MAFSPRRVAGIPLRPYFSPRRGEYGVAGRGELLATSPYGGGNVPSGPFSTPEGGSAGIAGEGGSWPPSLYGKSSSFGEATAATPS
jgi:hypothetical protein